jgi:hypothetical protein
MHGPVSNHGPPVGTDQAPEGCDILTAFHYKPEAYPSNRPVKDKRAPMLIEH